MEQRVSDAQKAEAELRIKLDYDVALQRMSDLYVAGMSLLSLRTRNAKVNAAKPVPYLSYVPVASSWTRGTIFVETCADLWLKQAVRAMVDRTFQVDD
eukprot:5379672-Amphidinium_carterae.1